MVKLFDSTFVLGSALVIASLVVAALALTRDDVPVIGTGALALVAVAVIGMAGCAVGGISQAPTIGWTAPTIVFGTVFGIAALLVIVAGLLGWISVLDSIVRFVPGQAVVFVTPARTAIFALAVLIGVKWLVAIGMAATTR